MLSLLSYLYGKVTNARNRLYDRGVFKTADLGAYTVSIGNITAGGTGKTPLAAYVAGILAGRGEIVCILTRGYGREKPGQRVLVSDGNEILVTARESGDEPFELAQKLIGRAIVVADADRVAAAHWAKRKFGVTAFVLDDGFQHRRAKRDLDIVCIDAGRPFGGGKMLPAGRLRELVDNLKRADIMMITRADLAGNIGDLKFEISNLAPNTPIFESDNRISGIIPLESFHTKIKDHSNGTVSQAGLAFCGLGNPDNFFDQLRQSDINVAATKTFPDHHVYKQADIANIEKSARETGAEILLTTAKDAVKLSNLRFEIPCYVVEIEIKLNDADAFAAML